MTASTRLANHWIIFDADNTLWDIEHLYDEARQQLVCFLDKEGFDPQVVEAFQRDRDKQLVQTYGYSACRFARSFEDTMYHFGGADICSSKVVHARKLALEVFEREPRHNQDVQEVFSTIRQSFNIGVITAGERWVQERRMAGFHLRDLIDEICIVEIKDSAVLKEFVDRLGIDVQKSWVVGDSLNSDVKPGVEAGLNVVWYRNHNWHENEHDSAFLDSNPGIHTIDTLSELVRILL